MEWYCYEMDEDDSVWLLFDLGEEEVKSEKTRNMVCLVRAGYLPSGTRRGGQSARDAQQRRQDACPRYLG